MLKQERTASNRQLQYERQTDTCNPYHRGITCLWVLPVLTDDWKVEFDVNDEGVSVKERPFSSEIAVVSRPGSRPDGVI